MSKKQNNIYKEVEEKLGYAVPKGINIISGSKQAPIKHRMEEYFKPRSDKDIDVMDLIIKAFKAMSLDIGITHIQNDISLKHLTDKSSTVQRVIFNRYFKLISLKYAGKTNNSVLPVLREFFNDGEIETWLNRIYSQVIPFFKKHEVYKHI